MPRPLTIKVMSTERLDRSSSPASPESDDEPEAAAEPPEKAAAEEKLEVYLFDRVLRQSITDKFSRQFKEDVAGREPAERRRAVLAFKASYLKHQLALAEVVTKTQKIVNENPDATAGELMKEITTPTLEESERRQLVDLAQDYEKQTQDLKGLIRQFVPDRVYGKQWIGPSHPRYQQELEKSRQPYGTSIPVRGEEITDPHSRQAARKAEAKAALFKYLTDGKAPRGKFSAKRRGNSLIVYAGDRDFAELYAGGNEGEMRDSLIKQAGRATAFHRAEKRRHPTAGREITFRTVIIRREYKPTSDYYYLSQLHPDITGARRRA